ncbi:MAG: bacterial Ig-like domain-containing protein [Candidatus Enteromonas sp.]|nr:bacterial Ig-like domain-containing protein [Candidatus Enteromonas sp.]
MRVKNAVTFLGLMGLASALMLPRQTAASLSAEAVPTIVDDMNDTSLMSDVYSMGTQSGDVGFGADGRYFSTYSGDVIPSASTVWDNAFGYVQYALSGQTAISVFADQPSDVGAPIVCFDTGAFASVERSENTASINWIRTEYAYAIPAGATWVRVYPMAYKANGVENWMQQITKIVIEEKTIESPVVPTIEDDLDSPKTQDMFGVATQSTNVGFGDDVRYFSTKSPSSAPNASNWWEADYAYLQYGVSGQNLATVVVDVAPEMLSSMPHIGFVANTGGNNSTFLAVNNYAVQTSDNWSRITYKFILPEGTQWVRVVFTVYASYNGLLASWGQQVTKVVLEHVDSLPPQDEDIPVIEPIVEPDPEPDPDPEPEPDPTIPTIEDDLDSPKTQDIYGATTQSGNVGFGADVRYVTTKSPSSAPDASNWWEGEYAYLQYGVSGQNLMTVLVDVAPEMLASMPHIGVVANTGGNNSTFLAVNNYAVQTSDNWSRITYKFILPEGTQWVRVVFSAYASYNGVLATWGQQVTKVVLEHVDSLPPQDENIPVIEPIVKPEDIPLETIADELNALEPGKNGIADFYGVNVVDYEGDYVVGSTKAPDEEPTDSTWWEGVYGYVQYAVDERLNMLSIDAYASKDVLDYCPDLLVYAGSGNSLAKVDVHNRIVGEPLESGLYPVTYRYVLTGQTAIRVVFSVYNAPDKAFTMPDQLLTKVTIEAVESLPEKDVVDAAHAEMASALRAYLSTIDLTVYDEEEQALIRYYVARGAQYIARGLASDDTEAIAAVKAQIEALPTTAEKFAASKEKLVQELQEAYASYSSSDYTAEDYAKITKIYQDAMDEIETSTSLDQIRQIVDDAKEDMAAVKKYEPIVLSSLSVSGMKTEFEVGEEFSTSGIVVTATYSDGSTKDVTAEAQIDSSKVNMGEAGTYSVKVTFLDQVTSYTVTVKAVEKPSDQKTGIGCGGSLLAASSLALSLVFLGGALILAKKKEN